MQTHYKLINDYFTSEYERRCMCATASKGFEKARFFLKNDNQGYFPRDWFEKYSADSQANPIPFERSEYQRGWKMIFETIARSLWEYKIFEPFLFHYNGIDFEFKISECNENGFGYVTCHAVPSFEPPLTWKFNSNVDFSEIDFDIDYE